MLKFKIVFVVLAIATGGVAANIVENPPQEWLDFSIFQPAEARKYLCDEVFLKRDIQNGLDYLKAVELFQRGKINEAVELCEKLAPDNTFAADMLYLLHSHGFYDYPVNYQKAIQYQIPMAKQRRFLYFDFHRTSLLPPSETEQTLSYPYYCYCEKHHGAFIMRPIKLTAKKPRRFCFDVIRACHGSGPSVLPFTRFQSYPLPPGGYDSRQEYFLKKLMIRLGNTQQMLESRVDGSTDMPSVTKAVLRGHPEAVSRWSGTIARASKPPAYEEYKKIAPAVKIAQTLCELAQKNGCKEQTSYTEPLNEAAIMYPNCEASSRALGLQMNSKIPAVRDTCRAELQRRSDPDARFYQSFLLPEPEASAKQWEFAMQGHLLSRKHLLYRAKNPADRQKMQDYLRESANRGDQTAREILLESAGFKGGWEGALERGRLGDPKGYPEAYKKLQSTFQYGNEYAPELDGMILLARDYAPARNFLIEVYSHIHATTIASGHLTPPSGQRQNIRTAAAYRAAFLRHNLNPDDFCKPKVQFTEPPPGLLHASHPEFFNASVSNTGEYLQLSFRARPVDHPVEVQLFLPDAARYSQMSILSPTDLPALVAFLSNQPFNHAITNPYSLHRSTHMHYAKVFNHITFRLDKITEAQEFNIEIQLTHPKTGNPEIAK